MKDYSNETVLSNLPYGSRYKFKIVISDTGSDYESTYSEEIDLRLGKVCLFRVYSHNINLFKMFVYKDWKYKWDRVGCSKIKIEWSKNDSFEYYLPSRISFQVNEMPSTLFTNEYDSKTGKRLFVRDL